MKTTLSIAAVIGVLGLGSLASARYAGGTGTASDPFVIATAAHLNEIGTYPDDWDKHFILISDVDLSGYKDSQFNLIGGWHDEAPPKNKAFGGVFDGQGHKIRNFSWTSNGVARIGLFRVVHLARIKNIGLENATVKATGGEDIGTLVGLSIQSVISACYSTGSLSASQLVAWQYAGGLVGNNQSGTVENCYSSVDVTGDAFRAGGLAGANLGTMMYCYSTGRIGTGGGLCGSGYGTVGCFWDVETSNQWESAGGTGKTADQMMNANTYLGWEACGNEGVWTIDDGKDYPRLAWEGKAGGPLPRQALSDFIPGGGVKNDPYRVSTPQQLNMIGLFPCAWDKHFVLADDIDLRGYKDTQFNLIGALSPAFTGVFDGTGHTIRNFSWRSPMPRQNIGLFSMTGGQIKNLALESVNIDGPAAYPLGGVAGYNSGTITNCHVTGALTMWGGGGIAGMNEGRIDGCHAAVEMSVTDTSGGGLVGLHMGGTISRCYSTGTISAFRAAGGLVGSTSGYALIENCYSLCKLSGMWECGGGFVGTIRSGGEISNCYSVGSVQGTGSAVLGGFAGIRENGATATNCFWNTQTSGWAVSAAGTGRTTTQMKTMSTFANAGWDFTGEMANGMDDIWIRCEGTDYPVLAWEGPVCGSKTPRTYTLTTSTTPGGSVTKPGKGAFVYNDGESVLIEAAADAGYAFTRWSGTAVDAGKVAKPDLPSTSVVVDADYTLVANFKINAFAEDFEKGSLGAGWSSPENSPWYVTSEDRHDGTYAARAGGIGDDETTSLILRVKSKEGRIRFWRRVSTEMGFDVCSFSIDGRLKDEVSGERGWEEVSFTIAAGDHVFVWEFKKDGASSSGADTVYIDDVYVPTEN